MLKRKECHGDMADIHVYTAKKLEGMADSLENLARTFDGDGQMGRNLSPVSYTHLTLPTKLPV